LTDLKIKIFYIKFNKMEKIQEPQEILILKNEAILHENENIILLRNEEEEIGPAALLITTL
jgi:hypothetical protein